jgi:hypothetical protein
VTDEQRQILDLALFDLSSDSGVRWSGEYKAEVAAALRALLAENAALKAKTDSYDRVRAEYVKWWRHWLDTFDGYEGSAWLSEYAKAMPSAHPDACSDVDDVLRRIDFKIGTAVAELAQRTAERDEARREACALRVLCTTTSKNCEQIAAERGWDCFKEVN